MLSLLLLLLLPLLSLPRGGGQSGPPTESHSTSQVPTGTHTHITQTDHTKGGHPKSSKHKQSPSQDKAILAAFPVAASFLLGSICEEGRWWALPRHAVFSNAFGFKSPALHRKLSATLRAAAAEAATLHAWQTNLLFGGVVMKPLLSKPSCEFVFDFVFERPSHRNRPPSPPQPNPLNSSGRPGLRFRRPSWRPRD